MSAGQDDMMRQDERSTTEIRFLHGRKTGMKERGNAILMVLIAIILITALAMTTFFLASSDVQDSQLHHKKNLADIVLQSALEQTVNKVLEMQNLGTLQEPFVGVDSLLGTTLFDNQAISANGEELGEFDVAFGNTLAINDEFSHGLSMTATAYIPSENDPRRVMKSASCVIDASLTPSRVFDYAYFINNWGWFYGNTIISNGNVRSNGQFDSGNYSPTINGTPRYEEVEENGGVYSLQDKIDDGGIYSGWDIIQSSNVRGMGGSASNQYDFQEKIPMPNLSDMGVYETLADNLNASISIAGTTLVDEVLGDDPGEKSNLFLEGTAADPIVLNGPVVVKGSVIIKGYVTGQGAIYAEGNVFIADDIQYVNPPATATPASTSQSDVETWMADNAGADALGLFAREHIVIGDYNSAYWNYYVVPWINNPSNKSEEDAGEDGIPNTIYGKDAIPNTADDDVLEDDGQWTVETYQAGDPLPSGKNIGDVIPGSGEDIDGDGAYDNTTQASELYIPASLDPSNWEGLSASYASYSNVATTSIAKIEAALYTNHTVAALVLAWGQDFELNGAMVSRNEAFVYGANSLTLNHDARLLAGGENFGFFLPKTWSSINVLGWVVNE